jgi:hypothetical protein
VSAVAAPVAVVVALVSMSPKSARLVLEVPIRPVNLRYEVPATEHAHSFPPLAQTFYCGLLAPGLALREVVHPFSPNASSLKKRPQDIRADVGGVQHLPMRAAEDKIPFPRNTASELLFHPLIMLTLSLHFV